MTESNRLGIAGDLMVLDTGASTGREKYERAIAALLEQKLAPADWLRLSLMGIGGLAGAAVCGALAVTEPATVPVLTRVTLMALSGIGLTWAALAGAIIRRGSVHAARHGTLAANLGFAFSLLAAIGIGATALFSEGRPAPIGLLLLPLSTLVLSVVVLLAHRIRLAELRLRRDLLEAELRRSKA